MPPSLALTKHVAASFPLRCSDSLPCSDSLACSETGLVGFTPGTQTFNTRTNGTLSLAVLSPGSQTLLPQQSGAAYPSSALAYPGLLYPSEGLVLILVPNT